MSRTSSIFALKVDVLCRRRWWNLQRGSMRAFHPIPSFLPGFRFYFQTEVSSKKVVWLLISPFFGQHSSRLKSAPRQWYATKVHLCHRVLSRTLPGKALAAWISRRLRFCWILWTGCDRDAVSAHSHWRVWASLCCEMEPCQPVAEVDLMFPFIIESCTVLALQISIEFRADGRCGASGHYEARPADVGVRVHSLSTIASSWSLARNGRWGYARLMLFCASLVSTFLIFELLFRVYWAGDLLVPFSVAYTKGWRRSTTLLCILAGIRELELDLDELPKEFKAFGVFNCLCDGGRHWSQLVCNMPCADYPRIHSCPFICCPVICKLLGHLSNVCFDVFLCLCRPHAKRSIAWFRISRMSQMRFLRTGGFPSHLQRQDGRPTLSIWFDKLKSWHVLATDHPSNSLRTVVGENSADNQRGFQF